MRVLVCGGRDYGDRAAVARELDDYLHRVSHLVIIQGGASGADQLARDWCVQRFVSYQHFPADWRRHGKAAGPIRNAQMLADGRPDVVLAFPGGRGTADMIRQARAAGVPVREVPHTPASGALKIEEADRDA